MAHQVLILCPSRSPSISLPQWKAAVDKADKSTGEGSREIKGDWVAFAMPKAMVV